MMGYTWLCCFLILPCFRSSSLQRSGSCCWKETKVNSLRWQHNQQGWNGHKKCWDGLQRNGSRLQVCMHWVQHNILLLIYTIHKNASSYKTPVKLLNDVSSFQSFSATCKKDCTTVFSHVSRRNPNSTTCSKTCICCTGIYSIRVRKE